MPKIFNRQVWKEKTESFLPKTKKAFNNSAYLILGASAFLPLFIALQNPDSIGSAMSEWITILSGLGSNLLAGKLQDWLSKEEVSLDEMVDLLKIAINENENIQKEIDQIIFEIKAIDLASSKLSEEDRQWFHQILKEEVGTKDPARIFHLYKGSQYIEYLNIEKYEETHNHFGPDNSSLINFYLRNLSNRCQQLPLGVLDKKYVNLDQENKFRTSDIYTSLYVYSYKTIGEGYFSSSELDDAYLENSFSPKNRDFAKAIFKLRSIKINLLDLISKSAGQRIYLLGDQGSGKSTFINYLSYLMLNKSDEVPESLRQHQVIRIILRHLSEKIPNNNGSRSEIIWDAIKTDFISVVGKEGGEEAFADYKRQLCATPVLLLLDGFDEVPRDNNQDQILLGILSEFMDSLPNDSIVLLTSRPYIYSKENCESFGFLPFVIEKFNQEQIELFITAWYQTIYLREGTETILTYEDKKNHLIDLLRSRKYLLEIASRPILLTLIAILHTSYGNLPEDRAELYENAVDLLLSRWQRRISSYDQNNKTNSEDEYIRRTLEFDESTLRSILEKVAYQNFYEQKKNDKSDITKSDLLYAFDSILPPNLKAGAVIDYISFRSGLLMPDGESYTFPHRSFQEFMCACYLLNQPDSIIKIIQLIENDLKWWREVFLLMVGRNHRSTSEAMNLIYKLIIPYISISKVNTEKIAEKILLAGDALIELRIIDDPIKSQNYKDEINHVRNLLEKVFEQKTLSSDIRYKSGRTLGELGDYRKGVNVIISNGEQIPDIDWIPIPVQNKFEISKYPITNAQYKCFISSGGYEDSRWWSDEGLSWLNSDKNRKEPVGWKKNKFFSNVAVEGINKFEVLAFINWINTKFDSNYQISIPNTYQWKASIIGDFEYQNNPIEGFRKADSDDFIFDLSIDARTYPVGFITAQSIFGVSDLIASNFEIVKHKNFNNMINKEYNNEIISVICYYNFLKKEKNYRFCYLGGFTSFMSLGVTFRVVRTKKQ